VKALSNAYFIIRTAYTGKSTMIRLLAEKYDGILCEENYRGTYPDSHQRQGCGYDIAIFANESTILLFW
jgi:hypothetical protein